MVRRVDRTRESDTCAANRNEVVELADLAPSATGRQGRARQSYQARLCISRPCSRQLGDSVCDGLEQVLGVVSHDLSDAVLDDECSDCGGGTRRSPSSAEVLGTCWTLVLVALMCR